MKIKEVPEDFIVDELFDLDDIRTTQEGPYFYFKLTKKDYTQMKAIQTVARIFNTSIKKIHFAGTKDRVAITSQLISIYGLSKQHFTKSLDYFNDKFEDMSLEFLGTGDERVNLGANKGNKFTITIKELTQKEIDLAVKKEKTISEVGVFNYFGSQRFGFANNSDKIGLCIIRNELEEAVKIILTSTSISNPNEEALTFSELVQDNWSRIKEGDKETITMLIEKMPRFLRDEKHVLFHLKNNKNDFPGAFRTLPKKLRTLYLSALQSRIFNTMIETGFHKEEIELPLITAKTEETKELLHFLEKHNFPKPSEFTLEHMPELKPLGDMRLIRIYPQNFSIEEQGEDFMTLSFELVSGSYATEVIESFFKAD